MPRVFISHSTRDREAVEQRIVALLHRHGIETWYSKEAIHVSQYWEKQIKKGLEECDWFLVALSPWANESEWVSAEVGWALENRKGKVMPVLLAPCDPTALNLKLGLIQHLDFTGDTAKARQALLRTWDKALLPDAGLAPLSAIIPATHGEDVVPTPLPLTGRSLGVPPEPARWKRWWPAYLGLLVLAVSLAVWQPWGGRSPAPPPTPTPAASPAPAKKSDIEVAVSVGPMSGPPRADDQRLIAEIPPDRRLTYQQTRQGDLVKIDYRMPYLQRHAKGGPVEGVPANQLFAWSYPSLSVQVVNNSPRTIMFTEAVAEVTESRENRDPLLMIHEHTFRSLLMVNEGWGEVIEPVVHFSILSAAQAPLAEPAVERRSLKLPSFATDAVVPLSRYIPESLENEDEALVVGEIEYGSRGQRRTLEFRTRIWLQVHPGCGVPPSFEYQLRLEAGKTGVYSVPLSQSIKPGESDHFLLRVASDRTAAYRLNLVLKAIDGTVVGRQTLELGVFVPRSRVRTGSRPAER